MQSGIPVLTRKGRDAITTAAPDISPLCRNILVQIDGKKSLDEILAMFRGLKGLDEAIEKLFRGNYMESSRDCRNLVKAMAVQLLGGKAQTLLNKIDDLHTKYGEQCWDHLDEIDKHARLFYGGIVADSLKAEITRLVQESKK